MAKPEWGHKRTCPKCSVNFYDLHRTPILCPGCGATFGPEVFTKVRRTRPTAVVEAAPVVKKKAPVAEDLDAKAGEDSPEGAAALDKIEDAESGDDDDIIEDPSELGEDKDDMVEVPPNVDGNDDKS